MKIHSLLLAVAIFIPVAMFGRPGQDEKKGTLTVQQNLTEVKITLSTDGLILPTQQSFYLKNLDHGDEVKLDMVYDPSSETPLSAIVKIPVHEGDNFELSVSELPSFPAPKYRVETFYYDTDSSDPLEYLHFSVL
ncbi:hypothetical protein [Sphingobacterium kitahiroshimense]|uniref:DUF3244 domain-containing protein n=1 Tax=Sphingobacterium kitahiroshimense TaxID=470446 RepID=A0ABV0BVQ8_9SPHI